MEPFNTRYTATFTLNIAQMIELENALRARLVRLMGFGVEDFDPETIDNDKIAWVREILDMLRPVVDEGVLAYEAEIARSEAQVLNNDEAVERFLNE